MARISGVDLPKKKKVLYGLQYIFGIGHHSSADILSKAKIDPNKANTTNNPIGNLLSINLSTNKNEINAKLIWVYPKKIITFSINQILLIIINIIISFYTK